MKIMIFIFIQTKRVGGNANTLLNCVYFSQIKVFRQFKVYWGVLTSTSGNVPARKGTSDW